MTATEKNKNVPELRFPDFEGEWDKKELGEIAKFISKGTTPQEFTKTGIRFVKIESLDGIRIRKEKCLFISETVHLKELKRSILQQGDLLFAIAGATVGKIGLVTEDILPANTNQALAIIRLNNKSQIFFMLHILDSRCMKKYIYQSMSIGAQPNLSLKQINDFEFFQPSLPEQQNIATFLTAVDKRIHMLTKKKENLEQYKKGVMQKLFSRELRFRDDNGNEFPEWEEKRLGDVCKIQSGFAFKSSRFQKSGIPIIRISNISNENNYTNLDNLVFYDEILNDANFIIEYGKLLIAMSGATTGKSCIYNLNQPAYLNQRVGMFISKTNKLVYEYLIHFVFSNYFKSQLSKLLVAGAQPNISSKDIESLKIPFPNKPEQQKIASFLSAIDKQIEQVARQIEHSNQWKKGLLQKMFV